MRKGARRLPFRFRRGCLRRGLLASGLWLSGALGAAACDMPGWKAPDVAPGSVVQSGGHLAWYSDLSNRYAHGVLGDALEPTKLSYWSEDIGRAICMPISTGSEDGVHVFEDIAPRLADLDRDGTPEIIAVRSHRDKGAQLVVYAVDAKRELRLVSQTPYIGTRNRWLAPVGAADLDADGRMEIAFVDRPHLAKRLRIWRYREGQLQHLLDVPGLTNHRIGEDFISGGVRVCAGRPEMITADATWSRIIATTFDGKAAHTRDLGPFRGPDSLRAALDCSDG